MLDIVYILGSIAFFVVMLVYVRACDALGRTNASDERAEP